MGAWGRKKIERGGMGKKRQESQAERGMGRREGNQRRPGREQEQ